MPKTPLLWQRPPGEKKRFGSHRWPSFLPVHFNLSPTNNTSPKRITGILQPKGIFHEERTIEGLYIHLNSREKQRLKGTQLWWILLDNGKPYLNNQSLKRSLSLGSPRCLWRLGLLWSSEFPVLIQVVSIKRVGMRDHTQECGSFSVGVQGRTLARTDCCPCL